MAYGQVETQKLGWFDWLLGGRVKGIIVREADIEAALQSLPTGVIVITVDPNGYFIFYEMPDRDQRIRFRARAAWLPNEPTVIFNRSNETKAGVTPQGQVLVMEGLHRTRAMARDHVMIDRNRGGVEQAPGWLDFTFDPDGSVQSQSSLDYFGPWTPVPAK